MKIIFRITLIIILFTGVIGIATIVSAFALKTSYEPPVSLDDCEAMEWKYGWGTCLDLAMYEQNKHIIKQNDWIICSELHKGTHGYLASDNWGDMPDKRTAHNYDNLIKLCGEIP